jgi:hypothetical protein
MIGIFHSRPRLSIVALTVRLVVRNSLESLERPARIELATFSLGS